MKQHSSTMQVADGTPLTMRTWTPDEHPPKGLIVIAHGYGEHSGRYEAVADYFTQQDYTLYAADHRGHGHSHGGKLGLIESMATLVDDLKHLIDFVDANPRPPIEDLKANLDLFKKLRA